MTFHLNPPLTAKNGHTLEVIIAGRVSDPGPGKQSILSLDDQESMHREWLIANTDLPFKVTVVAGSGSGEILDRDEYLRLLDLVGTGKYDLVLSEDLGRIVRRIYAHLFAEHCVDNGTRLISKNDHVDTLVDGWEDRSIFSAWHHERSNRDTSDRIKRAHRGRFKNGGALRRLIPGIIKPPGAKSDAELSMDPYWQDVYNQWFERLDKGESFSEIADWLNLIGAPTGCEKEEYDCQLVGQRTRNKVLKGLREQNKRMSVRVNKTGRRKAVNAPPELLQERLCPNLVFIEPERYDHILAKVEKENSKYSNGKKNSDDPPRNSRKRSRFPGHCAFCGICGRRFVFGGHGRKTFLMCDGARHHCCWVGVSLNGPLAAEKVAEAVAHELENLEGFAAEFEADLNEEATKLNDQLDTKIRAIDADLNRAKREAENLLDELRSGNRSQLIRDDLARIESKLAQLRFDRDEAEGTRVEKVVLPSPKELRELYHEAFRGLATDSFEFAQKLRKLVPRLVLFHVQLIDGGRLYLRGKFRLQLAALIPGVFELAYEQRQIHSTWRKDLADSEAQ
jgi:site-specific DNA recombinase